MDAFEIKRNEVLVAVVLLVLLMVSALAVIYCKNYSRSIFIEIERNERASDQYEVEWGQMQLELTTLAESDRVEALARTRLNLIMPPKESIIYIKP